MKKTLKVISASVAGILFSGCASINGAKGPNGPKLTGGGYTTENGTYAEVGVEFSSMGDFVAIVSPSRWKNPVKTGGSLSWVNPAAWSEDPGRTGRILLGEAVVVGGVAAVALSDSGGSSDSGSGSSGADADIPDPGSPPDTPF